MSEDSTIAVIGMGYIGLPTAAILASRGFHVIGVDISDRHVDAVNRGDVPFVEPGLAEFVAAGVSAGRLRAQRETPDADVYIVAVPTPFAHDHEVDLSYIDAATDALIPRLRQGSLVILESTSPPGTTERLAARVLAARPDLAPAGSDALVDFVHCPERVLPGRAMEELVTNDRVIGGITHSAAERARDLYASFCTGGLHLTDARTAELSKLAENSFRDVNIAFANELSLICDQLGIDVWELISLANRHPRVNILQPGPGVGGHCIAVDPWFIVSTAPEHARLIRTAREVNDGKPRWVAQRALELVSGQPEPVIAALGLAFKADIDDLRESPAIEVVEILARSGSHPRIIAVEPHVSRLPETLEALGVELAPLAEAVEQATVVLLLVDHAEFKAIDRSALTGKEILDTRGAWRTT